MKCIWRFWALPSPLRIAPCWRKNNRVFVHISGLAQTIRRNGSAALDLAYVAAGRLDGYWQLGNSPWDFAAGALLIQEAGGVVVGLDGNPDFFHPPYSLIGAGEALARKMVAEIGKTILAPW